MFTRKGTKLKTTIFDVSALSVAEKSKILNNAIEDQQNSGKSFSDKEKPMYATLCGIIPNSYTLNLGANKLGKSLFINDLFGIDPLLNEEASYKSEIFVKNNINYSRISTKSPTNQIKVTVPEQETARLIKNSFPKYHRRIDEIQTNGQDTTYYENGDDDDSSYSKTNNTIPNDDRSNSTIVFISEIDTIIQIETVCSLSELPLILSQQRQLAAIPRNHYSTRQILDRSFPKYAVFPASLNDILSRVKVKNSVTWRQYTADIDGYCTEPLEKNKIILNELFPLFFENDECGKFSSTDNIFIPVTIVLFLEGASHLFNSTDQIVQEQRTVRCPRFFVMETSRNYEWGFPRFRHQRPPHLTKCKAQTITDLIPTFDSIFALTNTITYVPKKYSTRLLKSKLNPVKELQLKTITLEDETYILPKSISEEDLFAQFHFFTASQVKEINTLNQTPSHAFFLNTLFDGRVKIPYYSSFLHGNLLNRFASYNYMPNMSIVNFISYPKGLLRTNSLNLETVFKDLNDRYIAFNKAFNNESLELIPQELFIMERVHALTVYLFESMGLAVISKSSRSSWTSFNVYDYVNVQIPRNHGFIPRELFVRFYRGEINCLEVSASSLAYIHEALFRMLYEETSEAITQHCRHIITESGRIFDYLITDFKQSNQINQLYKKCLKMNPEGIYSFLEVFHNYFFKKYNPQFSVFQETMFAKSLKDPQIVISNCIGSTLFNNLMDQLNHVLNIFNVWLRVVDRTPGDTNIEEIWKDLLTSDIYFSPATDHYEHYYLSNQNNERKNVYSMTKAEWKNNIESKTITTFPDFLNLLFNKLLEEYLRSLRRTK